VTRRDLTGYPVNLLVADKRCVVVGAGRIAAFKIEPLLDAGAQVRVIATRVDDQVRAWGNEGRLTVEERAFVDTDLDGAWLVTAATDDPATNRAVFEAGEVRRIFVNAADDPRNCSFTLMSVVRRGDLTITVGTGGRSPALAKWLRSRFETEFGPEYEVLLDLLSEAREELRAAGRSTEEPDWQAALDSGILDVVREGRLADAKELLASCLSSS